MSTYFEMLAHKINGRLAGSEVGIDGEIDAVLDLGLGLMTLVDRTCILRGCVGVSFHTLDRLVFELLHASFLVEIATPIVVVVGLKQVVAQAPMVFYLVGGSD
jgi:hypothetical protein